MLSNDVNDCSGSSRMHYFHVVFHFHAIMFTKEVLEAVSCEASRWVMIGFSTPTRKCNARLRLRYSYRIVTKARDRICNALGARFRLASRVD